MHTYLVKANIFLASVCFSLFCRVLDAQVDETIKKPSEFTSYITIPESGYPRFQKGLPSIWPPSLPSGAPEEQPSDRDPLGHWGAVADGWQLSIRLSTNRFLAREPVVAYAILRNVSTGPKPLHLFRGVHTPICDFELWDQTEKQRKPPKKRLITSGAGGRLVDPKTQYRVWVRLDKVHDLGAPGRYRIRGVAPVPNQDLGFGLVYTNVISGTVDFEVLPPAAAPGQTPGGGGIK
jgi:hypothetical protein